VHKYLIIIITSLSFAADYAGYSGAFLRMGTSARSLAMGSGFTAEIDQGFSAYHNPASVAFLNKRQLAFSHHALNLDRRLMMSSISTAYHLLQVWVWPGLAVESIIFRVVQLLVQKQKI